MSSIRVPNAAAIHDASDENTLAEIAVDDLSLVGGGEGITIPL